MIHFNMYIFGGCTSTLFQVSMYTQKIVVTLPQCKENDIRPWGLYFQKACKEATKLTPTNENSMHFEQEHPRNIN